MRLQPGRSIETASIGDFGIIAQRFAVHRIVGNVDFGRKLFAGPGS